MNLSSNGRGPVGPAIVIPGETPADRYAWLMTHMSRAERRRVQFEKQIRLAWLRENNPDAIAA
jgi:hypothetical protein